MKDRSLSSSLGSSFYQGGIEREGALLHPKKFSHPVSHKIDKLKYPHCDQRYTLHFIVEVTSLEPLVFFLTGVVGEPM